MRAKRVVLTALLASVTLLAAACTLVTDLNGYSETPSLATDSGSSARDSAASDSAPSADAATTDATPDNLVPSEDAGGSPCVTPDVIVGRSDTTNLVADKIPSSVIDAYPYVASMTAVARCVWVWVDAAPPSKNVRVAVYAHDASTGDPKVLLRNVVLLDVKAHAWNHVALAAPLSVAKGDNLWLGISPEGTQSDADIDVVEVLIRSGGCAPPYMHAGAIDELNGNPTNPFLYSDTFVGDCDAAIFLGP